MTVLRSDTPDGGGVRVLILGAGHYPHAQATRPMVPRLADIASARKSAVDFTTHIFTDWAERFEKPISFVELLANDATQPDGVEFSCDGIAPVQVDAPTIANILAARSRWLDAAGPGDILLFYCCGHGIWLPSASRTFLASDFGIDDESVWPNAVALDDFIVGLAEKPPRSQWLLFDCCANTPGEVLRQAKPAANPLVTFLHGRRKAMTDLHGALSQAVIASASPGTEAFGRTGGRSRFMDVFIDACSDAGFREPDAAGRAMLTLQSLELAMSTYRDRIAAIEDYDYYSFSRLTTSDAPEPPLLMRRDAPGQCILLVTSDPAIRLRSCELAIYHQQALIAGQSGPDAVERFRSHVAAYEHYDVRAGWPEEPPQQVRRLALPPLTEVKF